MGLFLKTVGQYRASAYEIARNLLRSRDSHRARAARLQRELEVQTQMNARLQSAQRQLEEQLRLAQQERDEARRQLHERSLALPNDPPLPHHSYGPRMISVCLQLAKRLGLRASTAALKIVLDWLSIPAQIPCWTSVRHWLCRMGVDELTQARQRQDDWIWLADHSNQIGQEKVLTILGIRERDLPPPGRALRHQDVRVLAVVPGTQWKRADVAAQYRALSEEVGIPKMLLTDGAVELRESASALKKDGKMPILLRDLKHFAANALERLIGGTAAFQAFTTLVGRTRSSIQQTELSHFTPPSPSPKARFMNLGAMLRWGEMALWQLEHPDSEARRGVEVHRMEEKMGWLRTYRHEIAQWRRIDRVMSESLGFINSHGLYRGAAKDLQRHLNAGRPAGDEQCESSAAMAQTLIDFVSSAEAQLAEGERGWLSTEILESAFGLYKALEGQHSKGGFTSLLAGFGALLRNCNPADVRDSFRRTSVTNTKQWVAAKLGKTLASKKMSAYRKTLSTACG